MSFGALAFTAPWLLLGLIALPILWLLLRAVPPAPIVRRFPGVALLLGLADEDRQADKTPWWLLLLRALAVAAAIIGFAGPVLNPADRAPGTGPLLIVLDGGWADARDWPRRMDKAAALLDEAGRAGRKVAVVRLTDAAERDRLSDGRGAGRAGWPRCSRSPGARQGLAGLGRSAARAAVSTAIGLPMAWIIRGRRCDLAAALQERGNLTVFQSPRVRVCAASGQLSTKGRSRLTAARLPAADVADLEVIARGPDPAGIDRELARGVCISTPGAPRRRPSSTLPPELRNRITRFELAGPAHGGRGQPDR